MNRLRLRVATVASSLLVLLLVLLWPRPEEVAPAPAPVSTAPRKPEPVPVPVPVPATEPPPIAAPAAPATPKDLVFTRDGHVDGVAVEFDDLSDEQQQHLLLGISFSWSAVSEVCLTPWARSQGLSELAVDYETVVDPAGLAELTLMDTPDLPDAVRTCIEDVAWAMPMPPLPVPGQWAETHHARLVIDPGDGRAPRSLEQLATRARKMLGTLAPQPPG